MRRLGLFALGLLLSFSVWAQSTTTTNLYVNGAPLKVNSLVLTVTTDNVPTCTWLDTLGYTTPVCLNVSEPTGGPQYYVDYTAGAGTACTHGSPCPNIQTVATTFAPTGPAQIYVKGNGYLNLTSGTLNGSAGNEIVISPWPGDNTPTNLTAQSGCASNNANTISGANIHNLIIDGGPSNLIKFVGSGCTSSQNGYDIIINVNNVIVHRVRMDGAAGSGPIIGFATGASAAHLKVINSEIYNSGYYGAYIGGGSGCPGGTNAFSDVSFINNIIRSVDGRGIQYEPRVSGSTGGQDSGNVFRHVGYNTSGFSSISDALTYADACGQKIDTHDAFNNLGYDLGGGLIYAGSSGSSMHFYNNSVDSWANATPVTTNSHGITCGSAGSSGNPGCTPEVYNNIFEDQVNSGVTPINNFTFCSTCTSHNDCPTAGTCGTNAVHDTTSAAAYVSTSTSSPNFLRTKSTSLAAGGGVNTSPVVTIDYAGVTRTVPYDIGAYSH